MNQVNTVIRYAVKPARTIAGWYVWAVIITEDGHDAWAKFPTKKTTSKREAAAICASLNEKLSFNN